MAHLHKSGAFYLDQSSLECKAGCGFFGNPEWLGYCSICFKQLNQNQQILQQQQQHQLLLQQQQLNYYNQQHQQQKKEQRPMSAMGTTRLVGSDTLDNNVQQQQQQKTLIHQHSHQPVRTPPSTPRQLSTDQPQRFSQRRQLEKKQQQDQPSWWTQKIVMTGYDTLTNLHNTILNTAKSSFRTSPSNSGAGAGGSGILNSNSDNSSIHSVSQSEYMHNSSSSPSSSFILNRKGSLQHQQHFLYDVAWMDCLRHTNKFAKDFLTLEKQSDKSINDLSDLVHDFYQTMNDRFEKQFLYKGATTDQLELLNDNMERILNEHIYQVIAARIINEDEEHNMAIQKRIRSLNWITVEHLEIDIDFKNNPIVHDLLDKAICQMIEMNSRTSSIDKLECIVQCSKTIFELLQVNQSNSHSQPFSADHFLPVLVFVVIQANPPMLPADIKYLTRFSNPRRLMSGETGYYFTNLCCALEFIEKVSGASLNISEEQFQKFLNGEEVPETKSQFNTYLCDGLRTMCSNDAALENLKKHNETRSAKIDQLTESIDVHLEINKAKLKETQTFASTLKEKLKPRLPKFYLELKEQNKQLASKLLPSFMRKQECEEKLVDIETSD